MNTITVSASKKYDVLIDQNLICNAADHICRFISPGKAAIISDSNVWPLYGKTVENSLAAKGIELFHYVIEAGESSKNGQTYLQLLSFLADNGLTRSDLIIALGGGVVGDLTGFAAATYLRGISFVQIPTSLLAMVDSSVGGKTAIDLPAGKNLAGAFYQPSLVLCDISVLDTLPAEVFVDGCAEVIKYGILYDSELLAHLEKYGTGFDREFVISRCIALKRDTVCADEFDTGARQMLNLGHTIGHAIERNSDFSISHGQAVSIGIAMISKACTENGLCNKESCFRIIKILEAFGLPVQTNQSEQEIYDSALSDKKRSSNTINLILPLEIGNCIIVPTSLADFKSTIKAGL